MPIRNPFEAMSFGLPRRRRTPFVGTGPTYPGQVGSMVEGPEEGYEGRDWSSYLKELQDVYLKEGPAAGAYGEHLNNMPTYTPPGKMGRIVAALTGAAEGYRSGPAAGYATAQGIIQSPYRMAMEQWGAQEQALRQQADIENAGKGRQVQFMREARELSADESQWKKTMQDYTLKENQFKADEQWRQDQKDRWARQGWETYTDDKGDLWTYDPSVGRESAHKIGRTSTATTMNQAERRLGFQGRTTAATEANVGLSRQRLGLERQREERLAGAAGAEEEVPIPAGEQDTARRMAYSRVIAKNPQWRGYVDENGELRADKMEKYPAGVQDFLRAVEEEEGNIFGHRRQGRSRIPIIR